MASSYYWAAWQGGSISLEYRIKLWRDCLESGEKALSAATPPGNSWLNARNAWWLGLMVVTSAVFFRPLVVVVGSSFWMDQYSQILVVVPISIALLFLEQKSVFSKVTYSVPGAVLFALFAGIFVFLAAHAARMDASIYISLSILLFSGCCIAIFVLCYGFEAFWAGLFPICFLILMTPLPDDLRTRVIVFLQNGSALVTDWFFTAAQIPFSRDGVVLALPTVTIEIAQECSGIRSSLILVLVGLVLGHLFLRSFWSKVVLLAVLIPLTIAKNALRIFTLSTLGMYVNPSFLTGRLHHQGGIVFFALSFVGLWAIVWILQKFEGRHPAPKVPQS
jgi:exosortase